MVLLGLDQLPSFPAAAPGRIGLMTNPTGIDARGVSAVDILAASGRLTALLACEHGVRGCVPAGEKVDSFTDEKTGVTVYSCYGGSTHLPEAALGAFDTLVYDIQDAGARFYTFIYSLSDAMEDCAKAGKKVVVLDRPNPLGGLQVQGTLLDESVSSFVGRFPIPTRYALTVGEYALWVKRRLKLDLDLTVIPMEGWNRSMYYADTGRLFVPPSPNLSTLHALNVYPGTCIFEGTNISEGRGTVLPFELIGAPFIDGDALVAVMNGKKLPGYYFRSAYFTPSCSKFAGELCCGVQIYVTDPERTDAPLMGFTLLDEIRKLAGESFGWTGSIDRLTGIKDFAETDRSPEELISGEAPKLLAWYEDAKEIMLYK
ncbi:MAG: DUF1343 domain-containing protein [Clostridiales bacterium]|nr:DUF1343 domain-containing protein [Clostridiales bacterium]